jgi:endoglucanase
MPTMTKLKLLNSNIIKLLSSKSIQAGLFLVVITSVGSYLILSSHASTPYASVNADSGTITNGAEKVVNASASDGYGVMFGSTSTSPSSDYTVSGSKIYNSAGQPVMIQGVDRDSTEWGCGEAVGDSGDSVPASDFTIMHNDWNANAVRIAMSQDIWLWGIAGCSSSQYQANIAAEVKAAHAAGMVAILDLHWSDADHADPGNAGAQQCMADPNSNTFWQQVAGVYKANPGVWFELYNEPRLSNWSAWEYGDSTTATCGFPIVGMQTLYNTVRATGANNVVVAGGIDSASHLDGVPLLSGKNIVYAIHPYSSAINGGNASSWSNNDWTNRFGYLVQENEAPVIATEFGDTTVDSDGTCGGTTYMQGILNYFYYYKIGFTAWAWYEDGCSYPSIISNAQGACLEDAGCVLQKNMLDPPSPSSP